MRRGRRGGHGGPEFGGSGEDSFVAVVVTKLTGALLFILLLTMVIMALLPKAVDPQTPARDAMADRTPALEITTPEVLPEAIAGRPYTLALAATGGRGPLRWGLDGPLPEGLSFDAHAGIIRGTPSRGTPQAVPVAFRVADGASTASRTASLVVYQSDRPLATPSRWIPKLPPVPWRAWLDRGFGFLVLLLVHMVGMNAIAGVERWASRDAGARPARFRVYRSLVRLASLTAAVALAVWLTRRHGA